MASNEKSTTFLSFKIKTELFDGNEIGTSIQRPGRLTTFKVPRDLSLGGAGPLRTQRVNTSKKIYTPNLNVVRNKNLNVKTSKGSTGRSKSRGTRQSERSIRGRSNRCGLVQTAGLFAEGAGALDIKKSNSFRFGSIESDYSDCLRRPALMKCNAKVDTSKENQHILDILGDSDEDFKDEKTDEEFVPIKLNEVEYEVGSDKASFLTISSEFDASAKSQISDKYPICLGEMFSKSEAVLFLMQLPDALPCQEAGALVNKIESAEAAKDFTLLSDLQEGQIGKIVRHSSGKFKLLLNDGNFDLDLGTESGFLQEVFSISTIREERSGSMINLGSIKAKVEATPNWDMLVNNYS